jgi:hypothetical protein
MFCLRKHIILFSVLVYANITTAQIGKKTEHFYYDHLNTSKPFFVENKGQIQDSKGEPL